MALWTIGITYGSQWKPNGNPMNLLSEQSNEHKSESAKTTKSNMNRKTWKKTLKMNVGKTHETESEQC